jgi:hypothetical protein
MSRLYTRATRDCPMPELDPSCVAAMRSYFERAGVTPDPLQETIACVETRSTKRPGLWDTLFARDTTQLSYAILTREWLVTAIRMPGAAQPSVLGLRIAGMEVRDYESTPSHQRIVDSGLDVTALPPLGAHRVTSFVGFGPEPAAQAFRAAVKQAVGQPA